MGSADRRLDSVRGVLATATSPRWLARFVTLLGVVSVASALTPELHSRLEAVLDLLPPFAPSAARAGAAAAGLVLLFLSRGLRRAKHRAWLAATVLTATTLVLHLAKGLDVEESVLSGVVLVALWAGRKEFVARPDPRSARSSGLTAGAAYVVAVALGWLLLLGEHRHEVPGTTGLQRLAEAALGVVGVTGPVQYDRPYAADRAALTLLVVGAAAALVVLAVLLRPAGGPHRMGADDDVRLRSLLDAAGDSDSLAYFGLRDDRSVIFSPTGKAAVSYRVVSGVSLAGGDPIGDPEAWPGAIAAWRDEATGYGWLPAVLGASQAGAVAYRRSGLDALEIGDEAVLEVGTFSLEGRPMRPVRQAVSRARRAGVVVHCDRAGDLTDDELARVVDAADEWRGGEVERGFSMALGRLGDPADAGCLVVRALDADGALHAVMQLVPWGADGLSLDLMRRSPTAPNGTVETMVAELMDRGPRLGVRRVSLNFAVFRSAFERGEQIGAGPVTRAWRAVLLRASHFWQIEALYRANAKYQPEWVPRYLCFPQARDVPAVTLAALQAEAFLSPPRLPGLRRREDDRVAGTTDVEGREPVGR